PISGSTELSADLDWFKFLVEPNRFYDIETSNLDSGSDTVMTLFAEDGLQSLDTDDQGGREFNASRIVWISPEQAPTGEKFFFVEVQQFLNGSSGVGYFLSVQSNGAPVLLPTNGGEVIGEIMEPGGMDAYIFSASQMSTLSAGLRTATDALNLFELRLLDRDGITLLKTQKNLEFDGLIETLEESADYYLLATEPYDGGAYLLSATLEAPVGNPDINLDGRIDHADFLLLLQGYREGTEP
ncbi:MAG: hypothetical protein KC931_23185, partial [Candidatus Omnitrophica bacterium]|nr:hypothetical protein [Candidatus Omnitrophota bacterium]